MNRFATGYPDIAWFFVLWGSTACAGFLAAENFLLAGVIVLLWAGFMAAHLLHLMEARLFISQPPNQAAPSHSLLASHLLGDMDRQEKARAGFSALRHFDAPLCALLLLTACYVVFAASADFWPMKTAAQARLDDLIQAYFHEAGYSVPVLQVAPLHAFFSLFAQVVTIVSAFWLAQYYGGLGRLSAVLVASGVAAFTAMCIAGFLHAFPASAFPVPLEGVWRGYGTAGLETSGALVGYNVNILSSFALRTGQYGSGACVFLYGAGVICALVFVRGLFREAEQRWASLLGLAILFLMAFADMNFIARPWLYPLWFSGWTVTGWSWVYSRRFEEKLYSLHQV